MQLTRLVCVAGGFVAVLSLGAKALRAAPLYIANYSFEDPANSPGNASNDSATDYTVFTGDNPVDGSGSFVGTFYPTSGNVPGGAPDGNQVLFTEFGTFDNTPAGVSQSLVESATDPTPLTVTPGATYTLLIDVGKRLQNNSDADYSVFFTAAGSEVGTALTGDDSTITSGTFDDDLSATYTAPLSAVPGEQLGFTIEQTGGADGSAQILFDDVRIDAGVPEPAAGALFSLAGIFFLRRRHVK
jgi:hypothetical protein